MQDGRVLHLRGRAAGLRARLLRRRHDPDAAGAGPVLSFYPADLARIHDEGYGDFARAAVCELLRRQPRSGLIVELGCGSGISCELLCAAGHDVLGIDISTAMLAIARERAPRARFVEGSLWDAELPACSAVTAFGEVVNYAADERAGPSRLPDLCERVFEALEPGGLFLFDFATPGRGTGARHAQEGQGWRVESEVSEDGPMLERRMVIEVDGRRREETHRLHLYDPDFVLKCLEGPGFSSEALDGYCEFGFWPGYGACAAVRP